jgi:hypothetical protein
MGSVTDVPEELHTAETLITFPTSIRPEDPKSRINTNNDPLLNNQLHGPESFRSYRSLSYSRISEHLMEPEGLITCSQEPSTGPYPESDQSTPYHPILSKIHLNIILVTFFLMAFLISPCVLDALPISSSLT